MVIQGKPKKVSAKAAKADPPRPSPVSRIDKIASLKRYPDKDYALDLLHQMARAVAPLIHEYNFKVGTLCEMYPKNPCLLGLNVNRGHKILIRMRPPHNDKTFYPMGDLIGTLLHELTHNVHGPHDAKFYALLDELRQKYESGSFLAKDYVCEENKLGAGFQAPWATPQSVRQKRLEALSKGTFKAEARRVGGKAPPLGNLRKAMLEAAERRLRDSKWCSQGQQQDIPDSADWEVQELPALGSQTGVPGASNEEYKEVIDLTLEATGDDKDEIEIIAVDACDSGHRPPTVLRPSMLEESTFRTTSGSFEMRSTVRYYVSSSPGRTFIGDESSLRRKVVADLDFDHIIESTSVEEMSETSMTAETVVSATEVARGVSGQEELKSVSEIEVQMTNPEEVSLGTRTSDGELPVNVAKSTRKKKTIERKSGKTKEATNSRKGKKVKHLKVTKKGEKEKIAKEITGTSPRTTEAPENIPESGLPSKRSRVRPKSEIAESDTNFQNLKKETCPSRRPSTRSTSVRKKRGEVKKESLEKISQRDKHTKQKTLARNKGRTSEKPPLAEAVPVTGSQKKRVQKVARCISFEDIFSL